MYPSTHLSRHTMYQVHTHCMNQTFPSRIPRLIAFVRGALIGQRELFTLTSYTRQPTKRPSPHIRKRQRGRAGGLLFHVGCCPGNTRYPCGGSWVNSRFEMSYMISILSPTVSSTVSSSVTYRYQQNAEL